MQRIELALRGGLGNQLFQVAGGIHYAKEFNSTLSVDDSALRKHPDPTRRNWIKKIHLNNFFSTDVKIDFRKIYLPQPMENFRLSRRSSFSEEQIIQASRFAPRMRISGYFQNSRYIRIADLQSVADVKRPLLNSISDNSAGIHIRLGDYLAHDWALPMAYYEEAIDVMLEYRCTQIHVYSDSPTIVQQFLKDKFPTVRFEFPESENVLNPLELLYRLSSYRRFISSNSTLAWWSSVINISEKDFLIQPEVWRGSLDFSTSVNLKFIKTA